MRILLVEDNERLRAIIGQAFTSHGFAVDTAECAADAEAAVQAVPYQAVVLDLGLPDRDGMTVLSFMRGKALTMPVLVLTSRDGKQAVIDGLNRGADDYLTKPFDMDELIARIRVLLRRPGHALSGTLSEQNVEFDTVERRVRINEAEIPFSRRELTALEQFMRRGHRMITKAEIEESLYGFGDEVDSNAVEVLIHRLRKKLSAAGASLEIHNLRGVGYMLSRKA
jgi:DNA-binding response OmpR family regulator